MYTHTMNSGGHPAPETKAMAGSATEVAEAFDEFMTAFEAFKEANPDQADISKDAFFPQSDWGSAAQEMLRKWEAGDEETVALWKTMNGWVMEGFNQTYADFGIEFDRVYLESGGSFEELVVSILTSDSFIYRK